jgi:hypothetical protein
MQKSNPQSKQAPICTTIGMKHFSLFQHQSTFLKQILKMKTNIDQRSKHNLLQRNNKFWKKIKAKMKAKRSTKKREHSLNNKSEN